MSHAPSCAALLWQLAEAYPPFLKSAANICEAHTLTSPIDVWTRLLVENDERCNAEHTFIVLDGLTDDAHVRFFVPLLKKLVANPAARQRTRVLITGKPSPFSILKEVGGVGLQTIKLGTVNLMDMELYINHRWTRWTCCKTGRSPKLLR